MKNPENRSIINELRNMKDRMESLFSEVFEGGAGDRDERSAEPLGWDPPVDVWETDDQWVFVADIPGVDDGELKVELNSVQIEISGKRETIPPGDAVNMTQVERVAGGFCRRLPLPRNLKTDLINAELKRGVLTITIPKEAPPKAPSVKIDVKSD